MTENYLPWQKKEINELFVKTFKRLILKARRVALLVKNRKLL